MDLINNTKFSIMLQFLSTWFGALILGAYVFGFIERIIDYKVYNPKASEEPQYWRWLKTIFFPLPTLWGWIDKLVRYIKEEMA